MPVPTAPIRTARLDLVPLRVSDAREMTGVLADPALYAFIGGEPPSTAELVERYRAQVRGSAADAREEWRNWIVRERSGGAAGFVQATIVRRDAAAGGGTPADGAPIVAEVAWLIGVPWQGRGYASEAAIALVAWLERHGVGAIVAHVHPGHLGSAAVAGRAGLVPTDAFVDGEQVWTRPAPRTPKDPDR